MNPMLPEPLPASRSARWRLNACAISLAVKPWRQIHRQPQPHTRLGKTMKASNPQPLPELNLLVVSPFVPFLHFQNRVTKRDNRCQKVPESDIRSSLVTSGHLPGCPCRQRGVNARQGGLDGADGTWRSPFARRPGWICLRSAVHAVGKGLINQKTSVKSQ